MKNKKQFMAIDQYGRTYHNLTHPRRDLREKLGGRVSKMFIDDKDGNVLHVGYVIGQFWLQVYEVSPMMIKQ